MRDQVTVEKMAEVLYTRYRLFYVRSSVLQQCTRQGEKFPRYRQKLESVGRLLHGAVFVDDPDYNVMNHIHVRRLPEPAGKKELDALVGQTDFQR